MFCPKVVLSLWTFCLWGCFVPLDVLSQGCFCPWTFSLRTLCLCTEKNAGVVILSWGLFLACRRKLYIQCYSIIYNVQYLTCRVLQHSGLQCKGANIPPPWSRAGNFTISYKPLAPPLPTSHPFKPIFPHMWYNFNKQKTTLTHQNSSRSNTVGNKYFFIPWTLWRVAKNWNS
jgi:hypothetical protein